MSLKYEHSSEALDITAMCVAPWSEWVVWIGGYYWEHAALSPYIYMYVCGVVVKDLSLLQYSQHTSGYMSNA